MRSGLVASVVALGLESLVVGSDVNTLVQVNTLLQADSHFIKTLHGLSVWVPNTNPCGF